MLVCCKHIYSPTTAFHKYGNEITTILQLMECQVLASVIIGSLQNLYRRMQWMYYMDGGMMGVKGLGEEKEVIMLASVCIC